MLLTMRVCDEPIYCGMVHCVALQLLLDKTQRMGYIPIVDKRLISKLMAELGKRTSKAKAAAARKNGKKGGRPRKAKP